MILKSRILTENTLNSPEENEEQLQIKGCGGTKETTQSPAPTSQMLKPSGSSIRVVAAASAE